MTRYYTLVFIFCVFVGNVSHAQWQSLNAPTGGNALDIEIDAATNKVYALVNNAKLFVSANDGGSWTEVGSVYNLYPTDLMLDGTNMYFVSYSVLYKSEDGGATWAKISANGQFTGGQKISKYGSTDTFFIWGYDGLFVSGDKGVNWKKIGDKSVGSALVTASGDLFFTTEDGISKHAFPTTGQTWDKANVSLKHSATSYNIKLAIFAGSVYATTDSDILKSSNNGDTWLSIKTATITETGFYNSVWGVANNGIYLILNDPYKVYFTSNGGTSWSTKTFPSINFSSSQINDIKFATDTKAFAAANTDGIFKTTDGASSWTVSSSGINLPVGRYITSSQGRIFLSVGYSSKGYWFSDNLGVAWAYKTLGNAIEKIVKLPNNNLLGVGNNQLQYSSDNGANWTAKTDGTYFRDVAFNTTFSANTFYAIGYTRIAKSTDGITWTDLSVTGLPAAYSGSNITQDNSGRLFINVYNNSLQRNEIYKVDGITAAGTTGTGTLLDIPLGQEDVDYGLSVANMFVSNNKFYLGSYGHIYVTSDQGTNWNVVNFSKSSLFPLMKGTDFAICAGTNGSLYISQDDGKTWTSTSLPTSSGNTFINGITEDASGDYYAAANLSPVLKFTNELVLPTASLPPYIDFGWQPTNGPYGGNVAKLLPDNSNNLYAISSGDFYKAGATVNSWIKKNGNTYFYDFELDKANNKLYAISYNILYSSINGGDTWDQVSSENIVQRRLLRRCPNGDLVLTAGTSVYVSTNGGISFGAAKYVSTTTLIREVVVTSSSAIIVYQRQRLSPFLNDAIISTDRGVTWNPMNLNASTASFSRISADSNGNLYSTVNPISKSSDNGVTWTSIVGNLPTTSVVSKVYVSPLNTLYVQVFTNGNYSLYKSVDGGSSWTKTGDFPTSFVGLNYMTWTGTRMILATSQSVYISEDDGATFTSKTVGITFGFYSDLELAGPSKLIVSANSLGFSTTDGMEWAQTDIHSIENFFRKPDGTLLGHSYSNLYSSTDNGATWSSISDLPADGLLKIFTHDGITYYGISNNKIFVTNTLTSWTELVTSGLPASNFNFQDLAVDLNGFVYALLYNQSVNKFECYQIVFGSASKLNRFSNPSTLLFREAKIYLYESTGSISFTSDGSNWTTKSSPSGQSLIIANNNYYFVPQYGGSLWLSRDEGASWQSIGLSNANNNLNFTHIVVNDYNGYAYATLSNSVVRKSANIVIPPETINPLMSVILPANAATNVAASTTLSITFNEACIPVSGKKVRIFDVDNTITPVGVIDATAGVQNAKTFTFTPTTPLSYEQEYFIIVDIGAFTDIFGNAFAGIINNTTWRFTIQPVPDAVKPTISYSLNNPAFTKGLTNKIQITATDEGGSGLNASSVKIFYRGITVSEGPAVANMALATGNIYEVTVPENWLDELGLEYKFEASDNSGNVQTSPSDGSYYNGYIAFPENDNPTLPSSVISSGGLKENYRIFSIPHKLNNASINTLFDEIISGVPGTDYRILNYNNETYSEYPGVSTIARGSGYWINIKNPATISIENASTPENTKTQLFSFTLKPGWNQIGNPYPFTISWNTVKAGNSNIGILKSFNGSGWIDDDKLNPFEGGFVLLNGSSNLTVPVPFTAKTSSGRTNDHVQDFEGGWLLPMRIENSKVHTIGGVGMHPEALQSLDPYDDAMPPKVFDIPEISFPHAEHFIRNFTRDIVPPQNEYIWNFILHAGEEPAILKWDVNAVKLLASQLYLFDEEEQKLIDMSEETSYKISSQKSAAFRIYFGISREKIKPSKIILGKPYPNPFTLRSNVSFTLPENTSGIYSVSLSVYDLLGRKVATVVQGEFSSGFYVGEWHPHQDEIKASLYFYRLAVSDGTSNILLTEKIISQK